jgi:hypothetical protein
MPPSLPHGTDKPPWRAPAGCHRRYGVDPWRALVDCSAAEATFGWRPAHRWPPG